MSRVVELRAGAREPQVGDRLAWDGLGWVPAVDIARPRGVTHVHTDTVVRVVMGPWRSPDFVAGSSGWQIDADGSAEFNNVTVRGTIYAEVGEIAGWTLAAGHLYAGSGANRVGLKPGTYPFYAGAEAEASAPFRVSTGGEVWATNAHVTGEIDANSGHIGTLDVDGVLTVGTGTPVIQIDGPNKFIQSSNFVSGYAGFQIAHTGDVEFNNATIRGSLHSAVFVKDLISAHAGTQLVTKSAGVLTTDYTTGGTMTVETPPGGSWLFDNSDVIRIKEEYASGVYESWVTVTRTITVNVYDTVLSSGDTTMYHKGTSVVDYGQSGDGGILQTADMANAPYLAIFTHAGEPWTTLTQHLRLGNLSGTGDFAADAYGIFIGDYAGDKWMSYDPSNSLRIRGDALIEGTVTADKISCTELSAISANLGTIMAGTINMYSGTWDVDATGFRLNADEICGQNAGVDEILIEKGSGKLVAGGGAATLDRWGLTFDPAAIMTAIQWGSVPGGDALAWVWGSTAPGLDLGTEARSPSTNATIGMMAVGKNAANQDEAAYLFIDGKYGNASKLRFRTSTGGGASTNRLWVTTSETHVYDNLLVGGGCHVGGTSDPGTDNLVVDGKVSIGTSTLTEMLRVVAPSSDATVEVVNIAHRSGSVKVGTVLSIGGNIASYTGGRAKLIGYSNPAHTGNSQFEIQTYDGSWHRGLYQNELGDVGIGTTPDMKLHILDSHGYGIGDVTHAGANASTDWNNLASVKITSLNNAMVLFVDGDSNARKAFIQVGHDAGGYSNVFGSLSLNPFGGNVGVGRTPASCLLEVEGLVMSTKGLRITGGGAPGGAAGYVTITGQEFTAGSGGTATLDMHPNGTVTQTTVDRWLCVYIGATVYYMPLFLAS